MLDVQLQVIVFCPYQLVYVYNNTAKDYFNINNRCLFINQSSLQHAEYADA